jgi:hypothetical protein
MTASAFSLSALFPSERFEVTAGDRVIGGYMGRHATSSAALHELAVHAIGGYGRVRQRTNHDVGRCSLVSPVHRDLKERGAPPG